MNARLASLLIPTALTLVLAACGNKGPLVLPTAPPPPEPPKARPGEVPVTISNVNAPPVATEPGKKGAAVPALDKMIVPPADAAPAQDKDKPKDGSGDAPKADEPTPAEPVPAEPKPAGGQGDG